MGFVGLVCGDDFFASDDECRVGDIELWLDALFERGIVTVSFDGLPRCWQTIERSLVITMRLSLLLLSLTVSADEAWVSL